MNKTIKALQNHKTIYIFERELVKLTGLENYPDYLNTVNHLVSEGVIEGVKAAGMNGKIPHSYKKFRILKSNEKTPLLEKLNYLYPGFNTDYYSRNSSELEKDYKCIQVLSDFLNRNKELKPSSLNERSFEIFTDEKFLTSSAGNSILCNLKFPLERLNIYKTREPFFDFYIEEPENNILIIENKDTWYSLKRVMLENGRLILCGRKFNILVYGEGWKILDSFEFIEEKTYKDRVRDIYYIGDLDYVGISIYNRLNEKYQEFEIKPLVELYDLMIEMSRGLNLKTMKLNQKRYKINEFMELLTNGRELAELFKARKYIPQEILGYQYFLKLQGGGHCERVLK